MQPIWTLNAERASLAVGDLCAEVSPGAPAAGLQALKWKAQPVAAAPLQLHTPLAADAQPPITEAYTRGADLVAAYAQSSAGSAQPHIYWRATSHDGCAVGVEAIVSMQTSLLDSQPASKSISQITAREVWLIDLAGDEAPKRIQPGTQSFVAVPSAAADGCLLLFRLAGNLSYAEMVHPSDFVSAELHYERAEAAVDSAQATIGWRLFPERLEKGVIRRTRIAGWFLPSEDDTAVSAMLAQRFTRESPPLTA